MKSFIIIACVCFCFACQQKSDKISFCTEDGLLDKFIDSISKEYHTISDNHFLHQNWEYITENLHSENDMLDYYESLRNGYLPGYSSMTDMNEMRIASIEYALSQDSIQNRLTISVRKKLLSTAVEKHRHKFGVEYTAPLYARATGILLILKTLKTDDANLVLNKICSYCGENNLNEAHKLYTNDLFNDCLLRYVSDYLTSN